jgi:hypothetical protein
VRSRRVLVLNVRCVIAGASVRIFVRGVRVRVRQAVQFLHRPSANPTPSSQITLLIIMGQGRGETGRDSSAWLRMALWARKGFFGSFGFSQFTRLRRAERLTQDKIEFVRELCNGCGCGVLSLLGRLISCLPYSKTKQSITDCFLYVSYHAMGQP